MCSFQYVVIFKKSERYLSLSIHYLTLWASQWDNLTLGNSFYYLPESWKKMHVFFLFNCSNHTFYDQRNIKRKLDLFFLEVERLMMKSIFFNPFVRCLHAQCIFARAVWLHLRAQCICMRNANLHAPYAHGLSGWQDFI